jgi:uncharacterized LabA/DUF88 family protein
MNVELAVDAMEFAEYIDQMVLFSGDGDFRSLVAAMQRRGVRVTVVSTIATQPPMIADDLRRQADVFVDLRELQPKISRDPAPRSRDNKGRNSNSCALQNDHERRTGAHGRAHGRRSIRGHLQAK